MIGLCLFCQSCDHVMKECKKTIFKKGICCFHCGLPQRAYGEFIHGDVMTGSCWEGLRDLVKGVCWYVFRDIDYREKYLRDLGVEERRMEGFKRWIGELADDGEIINGVKLMLNIWRDRR
jgi:hypothetical protein